MRSTSNYFNFCVTNQPFRHVCLSVYIYLLRVKTGAGETLVKVHRVRMTQSNQTRGHCLTPRNKVVGNDRGQDFLT